MKPDRTQLLAKTERQFQSDLPFVIYHKPNAEQLIGIFQKNDTLYEVEDFSEIGFVFAPFNTGKIVLIPQTKAEVLFSDYMPGNLLSKAAKIVTADNSEIKYDYEKRVGKAIAAIKSGAFEKVVLSRKETVGLSHFNLVSVFESLLDEYPTAFAYCFFHPKVGLWLGAFSEQLLKMQSQQLETMAVAGTQRYNEAAIWGKKEQAEQQFVTDFIVEKLQDQVSEIKISDPYNLKAGNLMHIKTDIQATLNSNSGLREIIQILHPTPAVCGFPKEAALAFIVENEGYDREYYSGFLGEFNTDFTHAGKATELYVNLRCMQVKGKQAILYIGGGITKDSIPEKEWLETVAKSLTMEHILEPN